MEILLSIVALAAILTALVYRSRCAAVIEARNNTERLLGEAHRQSTIMRSDIRLLVSDDPTEAAQSKQAYDKWRAEFGLPQKVEKRPPSPFDVVTVYLKTVN